MEDAGRRGVPSQGLRAVMGLDPGRAALGAAAVVAVLVAAAAGASGPVSAALWRALQLFLVATVGIIVFEGFRTYQELAAAKSQADLRSEYFRGLDADRRSLPHGSEGSPRPAGPEDSVDWLSGRHGVPVSVAEELKRLADLVVRDYITDWYAPLFGQNIEFPAAAHGEIMVAVSRLAGRIGGVNGLSFLLTEATPLLSNHVRLFTAIRGTAADTDPDAFAVGAEGGEARNEAAGRAGRGACPYDAGESVSRAQLRRQGDALRREYLRRNRLHPACRGDASRRRYLRHVSHQLVGRLASVPAQRCVATRILLAELFSAILLPSLQSLISPDNLNRWILTGLCLIADDAAAAAAARGPGEEALAAKASGQPAGAAGAGATTEPSSSAPSSPGGDFGDLRFRMRRMSEALVLGLEPEGEQSVEGPDVADCGDPALSLIQSTLSAGRAKLYLRRTQPGRFMLYRHHGALHGAGGEQDEEVVAPAALPTASAGELDEADGGSGPLLLSYRTHADFMIRQARIALLDGNFYAEHYGPCPSLTDLLRCYGPKLTARVAVEPGGDVVEEPLPWKQPTSPASERGASGGASPPDSRGFAARLKAIPSLRRRRKRRSRPETEAATEGQVGGGGGDIEPPTPQPSRAPAVGSDDVAQAALAADPERALRLAGPQWWCAGEWRLAEACMPETLVETVATQPAVDGPATPPREARLRRDVEAAKASATATRMMVLSSVGDHCEAIHRRRREDPESPITMGVGAAQELMSALFKVLTVGIRCDKELVGRAEHVLRETRAAAAAAAALDGGEDAESAPSAGVVVRTDAERLGQGGGDGAEPSVGECATLPAEAVQAAAADAAFAFVAPLTVEGWPLEDEDAAAIEAAEVTGGGDEASLLPLECFSGLHGSVRLLQWLIVGANRGVLALLVERLLKHRIRLIRRYERFAPIRDHSAALLPHVLAPLKHLPMALALYSPAARVEEGGGEAAEPGTPGTPDSTPDGQKEPSTATEPAGERGSGEGEAPAQGTGGDGAAEVPDSAGTDAVEWAVAEGEEGEGGEKGNEGGAIEGPPSPVPDPVRTSVPQLERQRRLRSAHSMRDILQRSTGALRGRDRRWSATSSVDSEDGAGPFRAHDLGSPLPQATDEPPAEAMAREAAAGEVTSANGLKGVRALLRGDVPVPGSGPLRARVVGSRTRSPASGMPHVEYEVAASLGSVRWRVWRRYKRFHALHVTLREADRVLYNLKLPGKRVLAHVLSGTSRRSFVDRRQRDLDTYLRAVAADAALADRAEFAYFLRPEAADADPTLRDGGGDGEVAEVEEGEEAEAVTTAALLAEAAEGEDAGPGSDGAVSPTGFVTQMGSSPTPHASPPRSPMSSRRGHGGASRGALSPSRASLSRTSSGSVNEGAEGDEDDSLHSEREAAALGVAASGEIEDGPPPAVDDAAVKAAAVAGKGELPRAASEDVRAPADAQYAFLRDGDGVRRRGLTRASTPPAGATPAGDDSDAEVRASRAETRSASPQFSAAAEMNVPFMSRGEGGETHAGGRERSSEKRAPRALKWLIPGTPRNWGKPVGSKDAMVPSHDAAPAAAAEAGQEEKEVKEAAVAAKEEGAGTEPHPASRRGSGKSVKGGKSARDKQSAAGPDTKAAPPQEPRPAPPAKEAAAREEHRAPPADALVLTPLEMRQAESTAFNLLRDVFELRGRSWLHRNALALTRGILRLSLHGSIYRSVREVNAQLNRADTAAGLLAWLREAVWPGDAPLEGSIDPPVEDQDLRRRELQRVLLARFPAAAQSILGPANARLGVLKVHELIQHDFLLENLFWDLFDLLLVTLFPEMGQPGEAGPEAGGAAASTAQAPAPAADHGAHSAEATASGAAPPKSPPRRGSAQAQAKGEGAAGRDGGEAAGKAHAQ